MSAQPRRVAVLDVDAFRAACRLRGADTNTEIAELLGVNRTTILRAIERDQKVGPYLLAAVAEAFGPEEMGSLIRVVDYAA